MKRGTSPAFAATLSFVFPGLGQLSLGRTRRAAIVAAPALVAVGFLVVAVEPFRISRVLDLLARPELVIAFLVANALLLVYHAGAIVDAYRMAGRGRQTSRLSPVILAVLLGATVALHGGVEWAGARTTMALDQIFGQGAIPDPGFGDVDASASPAPTPSLGPSVTPGATPVPTPTPTPVPAWAADGRLNVLLLGSDAGTGRWMLRTDTMIVLSVDVATGRAALFGLPRNMVGVPLPPESADAVPNGRFPDLLNAIYVYAMQHPSQFPGGDSRGFRAVSGAVQQLVGVRLDGFVSINLEGFVQLVNAIGGLWVDVPERVVDDHYPLEDGSGDIHIDIKAGCHRLSGRMALAYARSRHQDDDYHRMQRQQRVILALRRQLDPVALLPQAPHLFDVAEQNLMTSFSREDLPDLAELAARVDWRTVETVTFVPPTYPSHLTNAEISRIRAVVRGVFDEPVSPTGSATPTPAPARSCP